MQQERSRRAPFAATDRSRYRAAMSKTLLALCALSVASTTQAAVFEPADIRLGYTLVGTDVDTTVKSGPTKTTVSDSWDRSNRVFLDLLLGVSTPVLGVAFGGGVAGDFKHADSAGGSTDYQAWSGHVMAGPYVKIAVVRLELLPFVGLGSATLEQEASGQSSSNSAGYFEYGANLNLVATPPAFPLNAGVGVGWLNSSSEHDVNNLGAGSGSYTVEGGNYTISAFIGYHF